MKLGLVDVGGGLRGVYAAGVLDYCMDQNISFDCCIGVSAGSANVTSYLAGQRGRNYCYYCEYAMRKEYMGLSNFLKKSSYIDMEYVYGTLSNSDGEYPLDYTALCKNKAELFVVAEEAVTGRVKYFSREDICQDQYQILMASSSIPGVNRPYEIDGVPYFDGALGDPVPIQKAFNEGCDLVVLILTKPISVPREPGRDPFLAKMIQRKYPKSAENMRNRAKRYNEAVELAKEYQKQGKVLIISPDDTAGVTTLSRNTESLDRLYRKGYQNGAAILEWL
ncbi:MAG: patatin-like phospholipase family protein [Massiliimalia sp.]|jgi:predicted patatin/cPLA2 family phospholipase